MCVCVCVFHLVEVVCHNNAIFDISWLPGGNKLVSILKKNFFFLGGGGGTRNCLYILSRYSSCCHGVDSHYILLADRIW